VAEDTKKPVETKFPTPTTSPAAAAGGKALATKPSARSKAAKAAAPAAKRPARKRAPAIAKTATRAAKKAVTRPSTAKKSPLAKKDAHRKEPVVAKDNKKNKPAKVKKAKLVRDSFTMPEGEYALVAALKKRCLKVGVSVKKSEILRAAVANLAKLSDASLVAAVRRLEVIKTGRPAKGSK
jgi:hypothetical protein